MCSNRLHYYYWLNKARTGRHAEYRYAECHYAEYRYYAECRYAECLYDDCNYDECRGAGTATYLSVIPT